jgi:hypothetical protein
MYWIELQREHGFGVKRKHQHHLSCFISMTCTSSSSASFHRPRQVRAVARLDMLVRISELSWPGILFPMLMTCTRNKTAEQ